MRVWNFIIRLLVHVCPEGLIFHASIYEYCNVIMTSVRQLLEDSLQGIRKGLHWLRVRQSLVPINALLVAVTRAVKMMAIPLAVQVRFRVSLQLFVD